MTYTFEFGGARRDIQSTSYDKALRAIPYISDREIIAISATSIKGKINGRSFRRFLVETKPKGSPKKAIYMQGEYASEIITVFGSYSGKSISL